jgi:response regulator RpfG family c-di-GMP phosphodiesterase
MSDVTKPASVRLPAAPALAAEPKPRVLCVDDEPSLLDGLRTTLRRRFDVTTALGGEEGLRALEKASFAVAISDLHMPGMSGTKFLAKVRERAPDTVRALLTGQGDLDAAVAAVNEGQIFRFLTKPCPTETMQAAITAAVAQHRLITAERELLELTLRGCVKALNEVLSLANPAAFGRAERVRVHALAIAARAGLPDPWRLELAAMLAQVGTIGLPPEVSDKLATGSGLNDKERAMVARMPAITARVLDNIPRLEVVRAVLRAQEVPYNERSTVPADVRALGNALRLAADYDTLDARGVPNAEALELLRNRIGHYDPALLEALGRTREQPVERREIYVRELAVGMTLAADVQTPSGRLLIARGQELTAGTIERLRNMADAGSVGQPLQVLVVRPSKGN